jgi:aminoglycoside 3-N-acetyltransferase
MVSYREFINAFREVGVNLGQPVIVHAALSSVGDIRGGAETALGALLSVARGVMTPTFTYKTMITPEVGPENNAIRYGTGKDQNRMAEFFQMDMPADTLMGALAEAVRRHSDAQRSNHPILSFAGINVEEALEAQTPESPMAPIGVLAEQNGMVLLIGVNHTVNTSIHYAEYAAGRKQFVRWALTPQGIRECPGFGGCSDGFEQAAPLLQPFTRTARLGQATLKAIQLTPLITTLTDLIRQQPLALLCSKNDERCESVRRWVEAKNGQNSGRLQASLEQDEMSGGVSKV